MADTIALDAASAYEATIASARAYFERALMPESVGQDAIDALGADHIASTSQLFFTQCVRHARNRTSDRPVAWSRIASDLGMSPATLRRRMSDWSAPATV